MLPLLLLLALPLPAAAGERFEFEVDEDDGRRSPAAGAGGRRLGSIGPLTVSRPRFRLKRTAPSLEKFFVVNEASGELRTTNASLDRDAMCAEAEACCDSAVVCELTLDVKVIDVGNAENSQDVTVVLKVRDLNDNAPTFPHPRHVLTVDENSPPGKELRLPVAEDPDARSNAVRAYSLRVADEHFRVREVDLHGRPEAFLVVEKPLDRERTPVVNVTLVAIDGGSPPRSGSTTIVIRVKDKNDETPSFGFGERSVSLREDFPVGVVFQRFEATDNDLGLHSRLRYSLRETPPPPGGSAFVVNEANGAVSLRRRLDYERSTSHLLVLEAADCAGRCEGDVSARTGTATVTVSVADTNDEVPIISVMSLQASRRFSVEENAKANALVGWLTVTDADRVSYDSSGIQCRLRGSSGFVLQRQTGGVGGGGRGGGGGGGRAEFELRTTRPLDHEVTPVARLVVNCSDGGRPPRYSARPLRVAVNNTNDNRPLFRPQAVTLRLPENADPGRYVATLNATDADGDKVRYRLEEAADSRSFRLETHSGRLFAVETFDRELKERFRLKVTATDLGRPPQRSEPLDITVDVEDLNDNAPKFEHEIYRFAVPECQGADCSSTADRPLTVGFVKADDRDSGRNGEVRYSIGEYDAKRSFRINTSNGRLAAVRPLDRERRSVFSFSVFAHDSGDRPQSAVAQVTVTVEDRNDNAPRFIFPGPHNTTVETSYRNAKGATIAEAQAQDADAGENAELLYFIAAGNQRGLFDIGANDGRLALARRPTVDDLGAYQLLLEARDRGSPSLSGVAAITVRVSDIPADASPPGFDGGGGSRRRLPPGSVAGGVGSRNLLLVVCLVVVASVLAVVFLAIIVWLRRRPLPAPATDCGGGGRRFGEFRAKPQVKADIRLAVQPPAATLLPNARDKVFQCHFPTLPLPNDASELLHQHEASEPKVQTLKLGGGDGNMYYRIPPSEDSYDRNLSAAGAAVQQQQQQQQQQQHGYQVLQPGDRQWQRPETLQVDKDGRRSQQRCFNLVSSSFV